MPNGYAKPARQRPATKPKGELEGQSGKLVWG